jgi:hypothetical protein
MFDLLYQTGPRVALAIIGFFFFELFASLYYHDIKMLFGVEQYKIDVTFKIIIRFEMGCYRILSLRCAI